ncbi:hypothetical protein [Thalassobaculum sp.]|uniref:hypothetical protein n=1 Tax=Thalassobaculum sp. TaxID=2022740 RepID=UPI0032F04A0F
MNVVITPPKQTLKQKAKVKGRSGAGVSREEAIELGDAMLAERFDEARAELARLVAEVRESAAAAQPVADDRDPLLKLTRQIADTGGTFGHHAMTRVGRSLEGYLMALMGTGRRPEATVVTLHIEALGMLLGLDARGALGDGEIQLLDGLRKVAAKALAQAGAAPPAG